MSDNFVADPGSGGSTFAADDISGVLHMRFKPEHGADGAATDTSYTAPLPTAVAMRTDKMSDGTATLVSPVMTKIDIAADGQVVAATASKKTRCVAMFLVAGATATFNIESGTGSGTQLTGLISLTTNNVLVLPFNPAGWFETASGEALYFDFGTGGQVSGSITTITV